MMTTIFWSPLRPMSQHPQSEVPCTIIRSDNTITKGHWDGIQWVCQGNARKAIGWIETTQLCAALHPKEVPDYEAVAYQIRKMVFDLCEKHRNASSGFMAIDEMINVGIEGILKQHFPQQ